MGAVWFLLFVGGTYASPANLGAYQTQRSCIEAKSAIVSGKQWSDNRFVCVRND